jgi:mannose-1-phosphate guanylyltransferase/mannose-6-phosphate isomerase
MMIIPVLLSGGAGTRLWPLSCKLYPKQLLALHDDKTMLQNTLLRLGELSDLAAPIIVCNEVHRFMVAEQMQQITCTPAAIILEPIGRNTAPAVALAALQATENGDDPLLLVLPADHIIENAAALCTAIRTGIPAASENALLTFGIVPTGPETGYGYIKRGDNLALSHQSPVSSIFDVAEFVEKPDLDTAKNYLATGDYYWNSGMFLFRASTYLEQLEIYAPTMLAACRATWETKKADLDFTRLDAGDFAKCPADSIDYAVMEKTDLAAVLPLDAGWSDVGSWSALWEIGSADGDGNVSNGDVIVVDTCNSYIHAGSKLVATVGLQDVVIVETADAVLVASKDRVQDVKLVVEQLKKSEREEHLLHRRVNRPWGAYEGLDAGDGYLVKLITVNPGARLSLQSHQHRAEHWVVVRGTARVTCGEFIKQYEANQSVYIPIGEKHRLENTGLDLLEIVEVQTGGHLSEEDIERFDDLYGR